MDRIGTTIILATLLLVEFEPWPCRAQPSAVPATSIPPPRQGAEVGTIERQPAPIEPSDLNSAILVFPSLEDRLEAAARAPNDLRVPSNFATPLRLPTESASGIARRAAIPPPRPFGQQGPPPGPGSAALSPPVSPVGDPFARLKRAPLEPTDVGFPINLATALRLSDARPLIVAAAQASVWVAEAQLTRAKVLWVPTLTLGADYIRQRRAAARISI